MALAFKTSLTARPVARATRRSAVRVQATATPDNVKEAREWIDAWKSKQGGGSLVGPRDPKLQHWMPGALAPTYLDGSLPADFGFDPLFLGADAEKLKWYVQAEVFHCRLAMLAVAGILFPELAAGAGISWPGANVAWYDAGKFEYFAPAGPLAISMNILFFYVEMRRLMDIKNPGSVNTDPIFTNNKLPAGDVGYPGGIFNPFGYAKTDTKSWRTKEIKNGRLAMLAFAGFAVQAYTTGTTPLKNLGAHLADPWNTTVWSNSYHIPL